MLHTRSRRHALAHAGGSAAGKISSRRCHAYTRAGKSLRAVHGGRVGRGGVVEESVRMPASPELAARVSLQDSEQRVRSVPVTSGVGGGSRFRCHLGDRQLREERERSSGLERPQKRVGPMLHRPCSCEGRPCPLAGPRLLPRLQLNRRPRTRRLRPARGRSWTRGEERVCVHSRFAPLLEEPSQIRLIRPLHLPGFRGH